MAPLSLKIVLDDGAVTRTVKFETSTKVADAHAIIKEKILGADDEKEKQLFLTSADDDLSGIWLEPHRPLDFYMLRDGDSLLYLAKMRNLRVRMLDGSVKTLQVDQSKNIGELMLFICERIGITNHDEYGLCREEEEESEEGKENKPQTGMTTLKRRAQQRERDAKMEQLSRKLKTDDNVEWLDQHKTLRELGVDSTETLLLKRRLFFSDRNVDSRDPVQLNLLYVQTRDAILNGRHPVTEDQAQDCKMRWVHIRDVYRRILRKSLNKPAQEVKLYKYHAQLSFMRPFYREIINRGKNQDFESDDHDDIDNDEVKTYDDAIKPFDNYAKPYSDDVKKIIMDDTQVAENIDYAADTAFDSDDSDKTIGTLKSRSCKSIKIKDVFSQKEPATAGSTSSDKAPPSEFDPNDPVDSFLLGIGASLKKFTPYHLNLAKSKIFAVVQEHELQMIVQNPRKEPTPEPKQPTRDVSTSRHDHMYFSST